MTANRLLWTTLVVTVIVICVFVFAPREKIPGALQKVLIGMPVVCFIFWVIVLAFGWPPF